MIAPNTVNVCVTGVAGAYVELPAWLALMEQVPSPESVTVTPETLQTAVLMEPNATGNPELALALKLKGAAPRISVASVPKVMVWGLPATANVCVTAVAAA